MTDAQILLPALSDDAIVALTLWGEARGEGPEGRIAVANVIRNRSAQRGLSARAVCLQPKQFSCWSAAGGALNYGVLLDSARHLAAGEAPGPVLRECRWIAHGLLTDSFVDNTHGATHYLTADLLKSHPPSWAQGQKVLAHIGNHAFLRVA